MSRANGIVYKDGCKIAYFEYDGTSDFCYNPLRSTLREVHDNWRKNYSSNSCECGATPMDVALYTDYGKGYHWPGKVCMTCMAIVEGQRTFEIDTIDGVPPIDAQYSVVDVPQIGGPSEEA